MKLCERCHKERDEADFAQIASIGVFCSWCRANIQDVIDKYGEAAAKGWTFEPRLDLINLIEGEGKRVLDCGCWAGYTLAELEKRGHKPYGLDIQDNRTTAKETPFYKVDLASPPVELKPNLSNKHSTLDVACLPLRPNYVLFGDVLEHLVDPLPALDAAKRWLAPGGKVIISVPNMGWIGAVLQIANQHFPRDESGHFDKTHLRFYTVDILIETLNEAGFNVEKYLYRQFPDTPPFPEGTEDKTLFQWDNVIMSCDEGLYAALNAYQILMVARPK